MEELLLLQKKVLYETSSQVLSVSESYPYGHTLALRLSHIPNEFPSYKKKIYPVFGNVTYLVIQLPTRLVVKLWF